MIIYGVVYALLDPRTDVPRYIGQTRRTLKSRLQNHMTASSCYGARGEWIKELKQHKLTPKIVRLADAESKKQLDQLESWHIRLGYDLGLKLLNQNDTLRYPVFNNGRFVDPPRSIFLDEQQLKWSCYRDECREVVEEISRLENFADYLDSDQYQQDRAKIHKCIRCGERDTHVWWFTVIGGVVCSACAEKEKIDSRSWTWQLKSLEIRARQKYHFAKDLKIVTGSEEYRKDLQRISTLRCRLQ